jgi:hypothetical protein
MKILNAAQITKKIDAVRKHGVSFQNAVQAAAVSTVAHIATCRDTTLLARLYEAMPNGTRRKTMIDWVNAHVGGAVLCDYKGAGLTVALSDIKSAEWAEFVEKIGAIVEAMDAEPWHGYAKEKGEQDKLTLEAVKKYLTRKANSRDAEPEVAEKLAKLVAFAETL